jgi:hypothetical protein
VNEIAIDPLAVPVSQAHKLVGGSRSQFYKVWIGEGWVKPIDLGGRGESVIVREVEDAIRHRAEQIRSGTVKPPKRAAVRSHRRSVAA